MKVNASVKFSMPICLSVIFQNLDERYVAMINSAFFMVNPPKKVVQATKQVHPLEAYLRFLLTSKLEATEKSVSFVSKQIQR